MKIRNVNENGSENFGLSRMVKIFRMRKIYGIKILAHNIRDQIQAHNICCEL